MLALFERGWQRRRISSREQRRAFIARETEIVSPHLCPEIRLHLITPRCRLWRARPEDLEALSLEDPYWGFAWAGGQAMARYVLDHPQDLAGKRVLVFGAGAGPEAIAAARVGANVLASDIDPLALDALEMNAELNSVHVETTADDWIRDGLPDGDLVLGADVTYEFEQAAKVLERFRAFRAHTGRGAWLADPNRGFLSLTHLDPLATYEAPQDNGIDGSTLTSTRIYALR